MSSFLQLAVLGTAQMPASDAELTASAADDIVARLGAQERERALLLRAGGLALLRRAARLPLEISARPEPAGEDMLVAPSSRLGELLRDLLALADPALLLEALERMARARMRLPEELLPAALAKTTGRVREKLLPLLGARGAWLAAQRPEWSWGASRVVATDELPSDLDARWDDATPAERNRLLAAARRTSPEFSRALILRSYKQEKAEQRLAWLEILSGALTPEDAPILQAFTADRSAQVRTAALRLMWRLPESEVAVRVRARAEALLSFVAPSGGVLGKLKALPGAATSGLQVQLPPEAFDPAWEKDGIVETPPQGLGRRQWWLTQMLAAVHPEHWLSRFGAKREALVKAASEHELADALLDGLTSAALAHDAQAWYAPLFDVAPTIRTTPRFSERPRQALGARLALADAEPRMLELLGGPETYLFEFFPRPWPRSVAERFRDGLASYQPRWTQLLPLAALAMPVELLPAQVPVPEVPDNDYGARAYLAALQQFQSVAALRRNIAQEIPT